MRNIAQGYFVLSKNLFERLATFAFSGAQFNICTIVLSSQPSARQVPTAIPARRRRHVFESDHENEILFYKLRARPCL